ncbi:MAG: hypothetical protein RLZZ165_460 [Bacteroidota bacterium]|jgi:hypothetical protein
MIPKYNIFILNKLRFISLPIVEEGRSNLSAICTIVFAFDNMIGIRLRSSIVNLPLPISTQFSVYLHCTNLCASNLKPRNGGRE